MNQPESFYDSSYNNNFSENDTPKDELIQLALSTNTAIQNVSQSSDQNAEEYLAIGNNFYEQYITVGLEQNLDKAIQHYRLAVALKPSLSQGYVKLAMALWDKGEVDIETAIRHCKTALQYDANNAEAALYLGYFLQRSGHPEEAIRSFKTAIQKAPFSLSKARFALASLQIQTSLGNTDLPSHRKVSGFLQGITGFSLALSLLPFDRSTSQTIRKAISLDMLGFGLPAVEKVLTKLGLGKIALQLYRWTNGQLGTVPHFLLLQGDLEQKLNHPDAAVDTYRQAIELEPNNSDVHRRLADSYLSASNKNEAIQSLLKVIEQTPSDFDSYYRLGQLYTESCEWIYALYYFKTAANMQPENPYLYSNMAYVLFKLEDYEGAISAYHQAIKHGADPKWTATVAQTLGTLYFKVRQDLNTAINMFQFSCKLDPHNIESQSMLAELYCEQGNMDAAIRIFQTIVEQQPNHSDSHTYLGYLLWQRDRNQEAVQSYEKAIECDPQNAIAYNNLGVIYLDELRDPAKALQHFQKALIIKPNYTMACFNIGRTCELLCQEQDAAKAYGKASELNAENPELDPDEILRRLEHLFQA